MESTKDIPSIVSRKYTNLQPIATGESTQVYQGKPEEGQNVLAVKYIQPKKEGFKSRLDQIVNLKQLIHKNILTPEAYDFDLDTFELTFSMQLGVSLREELNNKTTFSSEECVLVLRDVLEGLEYAKTKFKVAHLNLKPENIIKVGDNYKLSDWSFASLGKETNSYFPMSPTKKDSSNSSAVYISPEKTSQGELSGSQIYKADIFSLGVILAEMNGITTKELESLVKEYNEEAFERKLSGLKHKIHDSVKDDKIVHLVGVMLQKRPEKRADSTEVLNYIERSFGNSGPKQQEAKEYEISNASALQYYFSLESAIQAKDKATNQGHYGKYSQSRREN